MGSLSKGRSSFQIKGEVLWLYVLMLGFSWEGLSLFGLFGFCSSVLGSILTFNVIWSIVNFVFYGPLFYHFFSC